MVGKCLFLSPSIYVLANSETKAPFIYHLSPLFLSGGAFAGTPFTQANASFYPPMDGIQTKPNLPTAKKIEKY